MKIKVIPSVLILFLSALLAYLFYVISGSTEQYLNALAISAFVSLFVCLEFGLGLRFNDSHRTVNSVVFSIFYFLLFVIEHTCFAIWGNSIPALVITSGLMLLVYLLVIYAISQVKK